MKRVFMSYPMNGKTEREMAESRERLTEIVKRTYGSDVEMIDNASCRKKKGAGKLYYLGEAIKKMDGVDAVIFDWGWDRTAGCRIEREVADLYMIPVIDAYKDYKRNISVIHDAIGSVREANIILRAGIKNLHDFAKCDVEKDIMKRVKGCGPQAAEIIKEKQEVVRRMLSEN